MPINVVVVVKNFNNPADNRSYALNEFGKLVTKMLKLV